MVTINIYVACNMKSIYPEHVVNIICTSCTRMCDFILQEAKVCNKVIIIQECRTSYFLDCSLVKISRFPHWYFNLLRGVRLFRTGWVSLGV